MKSEKTVGFINGLIIGFCLCWLIIVIGEDLSRPTNRYIARENLTLDNGITIPKGTVVAFKNHLPEGVTTYELFISEEFEHWFSYKDSKPHNYISPYYITGQTDSTLTIKESKNKSAN